jgi:hypothetical protein
MVMYNGRVVRVHYKGLMFTYLKMSTRGCISGAIFMYTMGSTLCISPSPSFAHPLSLSRSPFLSIPLLLERGSVSNRANTDVNGRGASLRYFAIVCARTYELTDA